MALGKHCGGGDAVADMAVGVLSGVSRSSARDGGGQPMVCTHLVGAPAAGASCRHKHDGRGGGQGGN